jgi:Uma2 family endonuclease
MTAMTTAPGLPFGRPLVADDLDRMPDDGHRYELLDGALLVTPAPGWAHQAVQIALGSMLWNVCPDGFVVLAAPFAVRLTLDTEVQPDVLVARREHMTPKNLPAPPVLAVEIRSPSTALIDLNLKRAVYERHGVQSYWLVDPDRDKPTVTALELDAAGRYAEIAHVTGDERYTTSTPFPFTVSPADLVARLGPGA